MKNLIYLTRRVTFSSSHRLYSNQLTEKENWEVFDKCSYENGHGHNYQLFITLKGYADPITGMLMNVSELKEIVQQHVLDEFDHRHLNKDIEEFKSLQPTVENIIVVIWKKLKPHCKNLLYELKLTETENIYTTYKGE